MTPEDLLTAIQSRAWYPIVGIALWLAMDLWKRLAPNLSAKIPDGWRWLPPVVVAAAGGFVDAYQSGASAGLAACVALYAVLGVAAPSMGLHSALRESPLPYAGGKAGGQ